MDLTKSDFLNYKECSSYAWFAKNKPEVISSKDMDPFLQGLIDQGAEVERWAYKKFPDGVHVRSFKEKAIETTQRLIIEGKKTIFQATFSDGELYAMVDILKWNEEDQGWDIYEVKSSSSKQDQDSGKRKNEYLDDAGFQRILLKRLGFEVVNVYLLQLNKEYVKNGPIDIDALFTADEITDRLEELEGIHEQEIIEALSFVNTTEEPTSCECRYKGRSRHCDAFAYLYPDTPDYSVYDLNNIGKSKRLLKDMVDQGVIAMDDITDGSKFNHMKLWQWQTHNTNTEIIKRDEIRSELDALVYPLYFLDYETLPSAIPKYDGTSPHQQVVFQYSLHLIEEEGGQIMHKEYLHTTQEAPMKAIAENLRKDIGNRGSVIVWHKTFEVPRTQEVAAAVPEHSTFLLALADRIYDLKDIVTKGYYHHKDFRGSASIKAVLPVMCPDLSYKVLNIQDGGQAMTTYRDLIFSEVYKGNEDQVVEDLLAYCKLDTWAMVRIWQEMKAFCD
jgi:hypothetical protein